MQATIEEFLRDQLLDRRQRLKTAAEGAGAARVRGLLEEVDAALARMDQGSWGICEACHEPVECDRLIADPLVRVCLDHLNEPERRALERDLELAAQVQKSLLPPCEIASRGWRVCYHYQPAGVVSGDYCDVVDAGDAGLYFMVGDVSGKGVAASMLMAHLHAMFRTLISVRLPLRVMMQHASRVFAESTLPTQYATLVCGRAFDNGRVEVCNAGHPRPLVVRDGIVSEVDSAGLPVGLFGEEEFAVTELCLEPSQSMLVFSDGVTEAMDHDGAFYGPERLSRIAACCGAEMPSALIAACREDLDSFCNGARRADDMTLFALGRA
ncbi:MAG TPA: SpoIIE family protein phosphatase [Bryobacteraceae bacterium]|jgi:sigma-B regulation protein RsbU (phosphoserine phosphatase)|nr:SpoIIE family protein phosphatase [Bryobacteraceae bacterium]